MMTFVLAASWLRKRVWFVGLIVTGGICGTLVICEAQQTKGAKSTVQKDGGVRKLQPADIAGLPPEFVEKLNARGCTIPQFGVIGRGGDEARAGRLGGVVLQGRELDDCHLLGKDDFVSGFAGEAGGCALPEAWKR